MLNKDIYQKNPESRKLVNEGVAQVNDDKSKIALDVLRYELETFVCEGQYEKGLSHILENFIKNIEQAQQPAVWVSGFYGSGKSHLVKMLRTLWMDEVFEDGATARGIASLPRNILDYLKEISTLGKRHGGLHSASGTLGSGSNKSVRLALLRIIFKSVGLPEHYPHARFIMWLKSEGIYEDVVRQVEEDGYDWEEELDNFYVAEGLHAALVKIKPTLFSSIKICVETLNNLYPYVEDISSDEMIKAIKQALTNDGEFPLTLIVLDEVQQYIGTDSQRSIEVQEVVEACCKNIGGKLMFIATGQTAVTGTSNLKKLEGRFTIRIELSDMDVDTVIRKVILAKVPEAIKEINDVMQKNEGEISRHLAGTSIAHKQSDTDFLPQDYPILPVRRRFWENTLRVLDQTGTDSQLRNQLSLIHKAIQTNLNKSIGNVIPADYLYFESADKLLQARILPRKVYEKTMAWVNGNEDEKLMARSCGVVFLINKLSSENKDIGIKCTTDTIADLLVEDLIAGSGAIRSKLPELLDGCEILMKVDEEYRIQTEESAAWNDEFLKNKSILANEAHKVDAERADRVRRTFGESVKKVLLNHGESKVPRDVFITYDNQLPNDADKKIYVWVRDGWSIDENSVKADARVAGNESPTIFVFIPKRSADELRDQIINYKAASMTLDNRGVPSNPEGKEAQASMITIKDTADKKIKELLDESFSGIRVYQGGGNELSDISLEDTIYEAAKNSLLRLYPFFNTADHPGWAKVYEKAKEGAPDALKAVGDSGEPSNNSVCKAILAHIASGKHGTEIREKFENPPYGWPKDAIDGAIQVLFVAGLIKVKGATPTDLARKDIGKTFFNVEATTITTAQRIQIRKIFQALGIKCNPGEESAHTSTFTAKLQELADNAGGEPPKPEKPDVSLIESIRMSSGNEQLLNIYNNKESLFQNINEWDELSEQINNRMPAWNKLQRLKHHANDIKDAEVLITQANSIEDHRQLLMEPDPVQPLISGFVQLLREKLIKLKDEYDKTWENGVNKLRADENWNQLTPEQKSNLRGEQQLLDSCKPSIDLSSTDSVLRTLESLPIQTFRDRLAALPARFNNVLEKAAELCEPEIQLVDVAKFTLKTEGEIDKWVADLKGKLKDALKRGPVRLK